jgi:hypothetical protein
MLSNVSHDYLLDPASSFAPGRGLERLPSGLWSATTTACAQPHAGHAGAGRVDATTIDYGFVGVAVDDTIVGADVDIGPYFSAGGSAGTHALRLVAIAFVRDLDPQFFDASEDVTYAGAACACARASHFVGAVKMGGMLSYDVDAKEGEVHGRALDFVRATLEARGAHVTETRVGGLEVEGIDALLAPGGSARPRIAFHVSNPVPIAYDVYPLEDVCKFALPEPEVTPVPLDFGDAAYGVEVTRLIHVVNRAAVDVTASYHGTDLVVPARGSADLNASWSPQGDGLGCDVQEREEEIVFSPADATAPCTPKRRAVRVEERVRAGRSSAVQRQHVDTGTHRAPDYRATAFDLACPPDYAPSACRAENADCHGGPCTSGGYALTATLTGAGCHFGCQGPTSLILPTNSCRFDGVLECRLRCAGP